MPKQAFPFKLLLLHRAEEHIASEDFRSKTNEFNCINNMIQVIGNMGIIDAMNINTHIKAEHN